MRCQAESDARSIAVYGGGGSLLALVCSKN